MGKRKRLLVLLVVVDLVVPEKGLASSQHGGARRGQYQRAYLVTVSPEVILGTDILVGVLGLVLLGSVVGNVLPVSIPPQLCVDAGDDQARNGDAAGIISIESPTPL